MTSRQTTPNPKMTDPADTNVHRGKKNKPDATDDLADPASRDSRAPHDRGVVHDGNLDGAREEMIKDVGKDKEAWKKGRTQN